MKRALCLLLLALPVTPRTLGSQVDPSVKASDEIAVAVNAKNNIDRLTSADLRKILLGDRTFWKGNEQILMVLRQPGTRERDRVIEVLLKMTNVDFERHWQAKVFRGEASGVPLAVPSDGMASEYVADTPGAIAFIIGKNLRHDVKVLKIDDKLPGQPGYPIK